MIVEALSFLGERSGELAAKVTEHLFLTGMSTLIAVAAGIPLGIWLSRRPRIKSLGMSVIGILQTIPSLAMLALLLPFFGIGIAPALVALVLYALLPIVRNTLTGIENIAPEHTEAADALGLTPAQKLRIIVLPLALPTIVAGIRTAAVIGVGVATLATFIGAGGLGDFINRGLATNNTALILLGAIPAAMLAILIDFLVRRLELLVSSGRSRRRTGGVNQNTRRNALTAVSLIALMAVVGLSMWPGGDDARPIRIGSKNFTEQFVLAEILAQLIEENTEYAVERRLNLGSIVILHQAMLNDDIDLYPEYTGTAYRVIMKQEDNPGAELIYRAVRHHYQDQYSLTWLSPFGFNDTYAVAVRKEFADANRLETISDLAPLAPDLNIGFLSEFLERPDGYKGLTAAYGLNFGNTTEMDMSLLYQAARSGDIDVLSGNTTDGRIPAYKLTVLRDDRNYFPPYYAATIVRSELLEQYPELADVLEIIAGMIDEDTMQRLNYEVDELGLSPRAVAGKFLDSITTTNQE